LFFQKQKFKGVVPQSNSRMNVLHDAIGVGLFIMASLERKIKRVRETYQLLWRYRRAPSSAQDRGVLLLRLS
jgi:hypothetical protein